MSAAFNLSKKLEWMSRRLRWIDEATSIKEWVDAMESVYSLMNRVSTKTQAYEDGWRPWHATEIDKNPFGSRKDEAGKNGEMVNQNDVNMTVQQHVKPAAQKLVRWTKSPSRLKKLTTKITKKTTQPLLGKAKSGKALKKTAKERVVFKMPIPPKIPTKSTVAMDVEKDVLDTDKGNAQKRMDCLYGGSKAGNSEWGLQKEADYNVVLTDAGRNKVAVIKGVHDLTGICLIDCEDLVDDNHPTILEEVEKAEAMAAKALLEEAGASVVIEKF